MESILSGIVETMVDYLDYHECFRGYSEKSIIKFYKITKKYISKTKKCKYKTKFINITIKYIERLNRLNNNCYQELIESNQRDSIILMIYNLAAKQNLNLNIEEDFTTVYRNW